MSLDYVLERSTALYKAVVEDEDGNPIPAASIDEMTLTYYDVDTNAIINSRDDQPVLNDNNVTIDGSGILLWTMQPDDTVIVATAPAAHDFELHRALFEWTYAGGTKYGKHEVDIRVRNLNKVA